MGLLAEISRRHGFLALAAFAGPVISVAVPIAVHAVGLELPRPSPTGGMLATSLVLAPVLEELVFRGGLQPVVDRTRLGRKRWAGITVGNAFTSVLFAAAHLFTGPPWLAAGVFFPSLVFGRLAQIYPTLVPSVLVHAWFNACYLLSLYAWR